jgi:predicted peptidase
MKRCTLLFLLLLSSALAMAQIFPATPTSTAKITLSSPTVITLPTTQAALTATASTSVGSIKTTTYWWREMTTGGAVIPKLTTTTTDSNVVVTGLTKPGFYTFRLSVYKSQAGKPDTMFYQDITVGVLASSASVLANAGNDSTGWKSQNGLDTARLVGTYSSGATSYSWRQLTGTAVSVLSATASTAKVPLVVPGLYSFELSINAGASKDTVSVNYRDFQQKNLLGCRPGYNTTTHTGGKSFLLPPSTNSIDPNNGNKTYLKYQRQYINRDNVLGEPLLGGDTLRIRGWGVDSVGNIDIGDFAGGPGCPVYIVPDSTIPVVVRHVNFFIGKADSNMVQHAILDGTTLRSLGIPYGFIYDNQNRSSYTQITLGSLQAQHVSNFTVRGFKSLRAGLFQIQAPPTVNLWDRYDKFELRDIRVHDCYVDESKAEALYLGYIRPDGGWLFNVYGAGPAIRAAKVFNNVLMNASWNGLQTYYGQDSFQVYRNFIYKAGVLNQSGEQSGIQYGLGSVGRIDSNVVINSTGYSLDVYGYGTVSIRHNFLDSANNGLSSGSPAVPQVSGLFLNDARPLTTVIGSPQLTPVISGNVISRPANNYINIGPGIAAGSITGNIFVPDIGWSYTAISDASGSTQSGNVTKSIAYPAVVSVVPSTPSGYTITAAYLGDQQSFTDIGALNTWLVNKAVGTATTPPPTVSAGVDQTITLPTAQVSLSATATPANTHAITSYSWVKVSGPGATSIANPTTAAVTASGLQAGVYVFRVTVTQDDQQSASDDVQVTVNVASGVAAPTVNAGADKIVQLPASQVSISAVATPAVSHSITYLWTKVSGPSAVAFSSTTTSGTTISGLQAGIYTVRLSVTQDDGQTVSDDVKITVLASSGVASGGTVPHQSAQQPWWVRWAAPVKNPVDTTIKDTVKAPPILINVVDTIQVNFAGNSTGYVLDSATSKWNNRTWKAGFNTYGSFFWKSLLRTNVKVAFQHGSGYTSSFDCPSGVLAPPIVLKYGSIASGTTDTTMGDKTLGGRNIVFTNLNPSNTYKFVLLSSQTVNNPGVEILSSQGKVDTLKNSNSNCTLTASLSNLVPNDTGRLVINLRGAQATYNTHLNGFLLIRQSGYDVGDTAISAGTVATPSPGDGGTTCTTCSVASPSSLSVSTGWLTSQTTQGAYVYKPKGYADASNASITYPLAIYLHPIAQKGNATTQKLLGQGLPLQLSTGQDIAMMVMAPQLDSAGPSDAWTPLKVKAAYDWAVANLRVDKNRVYVVGAEAGATGGWNFTHDNPSLVAAFLLAGGTYDTTSANISSVLPVPGMFVHGLTDAVNSYTSPAAVIQATNGRRPRPFIPYTVHYVPGVGSSPTLWDDHLFKKATADLDFEQYLLKHSKDSVYQATKWIEELEGFAARGQYEKLNASYRITRTLVDTLGIFAAADPRRTARNTAKNGLINRYLNAMNALNTYYGTRYLIDMGGSGSATINGLPNPATGNALLGLVATTGTTSAYGFSVLSQATTPAQISTFGVSNRYFGQDSLTMATAAAISGTGGSYKFTGLDPSKKYNIIVYGARDAAPSDPTQIPGITVLSDTAARYIPVAYNTERFVELKNLSPVSSGDLSFQIKGGWNLNTGIAPRLDSVTGQYATAVSNLTGAYSSNVGAVNAIRLVEQAPHSSYVFNLGTADDSVSAGIGHMGTGNNQGYYGNGWHDTATARFIQKVGFESMRAGGSDVVMTNNSPSTFIWRYQKYVDSMNLNNNIMILYQPDGTHKDTTRYAGTFSAAVTWRGLYLPIWNDNGTVNPNNLFGQYVYNMVQNFGAYVKRWEIINEPDFTGVPDSKVWLSRVPLPGDLVNLQAPFYHYVRMLRIAYEIIHRYQQGALVGPGGLGYYPFADALGRYTDNPLDGSVSADYPHKGLSYCDMMPYHVYPYYYVKVWNQALGKSVYTYTSDSVARVMRTFQMNYDTTMKRYGYDGVQKPKKKYILTEFNVSSQSTVNVYGAEDFQRNSLLKIYAVLMKLGIDQAIMYTNGDQLDAIPKDSLAKANDEYKYMGLLGNLIHLAPGSETYHEAWWALKTFNNLTYNQGYYYDSTRTLACGFTAGGAAPATGAVDGIALKNATTGQYIYMIWAVQHTSQSETQTATYNFPGGIATGTLNRYYWDWSKIGHADTTPATGIVVDGTPVIIKP